MCTEETLARRTTKRHAEAETAQRVEIDMLALHHSAEQSGMPFDIAGGLRATYRAHHVTFRFDPVMKRSFINTTPSCC